MGLESVHVLPSPKILFFSRVQIITARYTTCSTTGSSDATFCYSTFSVNKLIYVDALRYFFFYKISFIEMMFPSFVRVYTNIHCTEFDAHLKLKENKIVTVIRKVCPSDLWTKMINKHDETTQIIVPHTRELKQLRRRPQRRLQKKQ